jgi:lipoate-protein ligase A
MRRDAALLERLDAPGGPPEAVLRVYGFSPAGITLGLSQSPERELDLAACRRDRVEVAVRPTGGRAIYHDQEWTYALAARIDDPRWGGSLREAYARASALVVAALERLGIPARLAPGARRAELDRPGGPAGAAAPCFASTARHEIVLGDRKLVGSAQRRTARALLQQGSILLGPSHRRLGAYLAHGPAREHAHRQLEGGAAEAGAAWRARDTAPLVHALLEVLGVEARRVDARAGLDLLTGSSGAPYPAGRPVDRDTSRTS